MNNPPFILVVDDDPDDRFFLSEAINNVTPNAKLEELRNGNDALTFLESNCKGEGDAKPDLIFLDLNMDELDGLKTAQVIKKSVDFCHIPVVVLTTSASERDRELCLKVGASNFYTKPYSIEELTIIVREITKRYLA